MRLLHNNYFWFSANLLVLLFLLVLFALAPHLDLQFSALFYDANRGFYLGDNALNQLIYKGTRWFSAVLVVAVLVAFAYSLCKQRSRLCTSCTFVICALLLVPGGVVDLLLKNNWDRARPRQVQQFGGQAEFTPYYKISDQCHKNCSFVSGHAAAGFSLLILGFVFSKRRRLIWLLATCCGLSIGLVRIVQGGHFLSDVLLCYFVVYAGFALVYQLFCKLGYCPDMHRNAPAPAT